MYVTNNINLDSSKVLFTKRGKSRKRSRNESSDVCALSQQQQEASDERFFKMVEEARLQKEIKLEEKQRRDESSIQSVASMRCI